MKFFLAAFLFVSVTTSGQRAKPYDSAAYIRECIEFIREVKGDQFARPSFILTDRPAQINNAFCSASGFDTAVFAADDIAIIEAHNYPRLKEWTKTMFPDKRIIQNDSIEILFKGKADGWGAFNRRYGVGFVSFSIPIFLQNGTYCLFYSDEHCGYECGGGSLILYHKENGHWKQARSFCQWIS